MMLRVSSTLNGEPADLHAVTGEPAQRRDDGAGRVPAQDALLDLVEATLAPAPADLVEVRQRVVEALGDAALVEASAVIGNFERMTRIADGAGIPLDAPVAAMTADLREELGINTFGSADNTPEVGWLKRQVFRLLQPMMLRRLRKQIN